MGCKLLVPLPLEVAQHFIERWAGGRSRRLEPPVTFGATKTPKTLFLNPYQLPVHSRLCRCAPTSTPMLSTNEAFRFAMNGPFLSCVLPDCSRRPSPSVGVLEDAQKGWTESTYANFDRSVGHPTYLEDSCSDARPMPGALKEWDRLDGFLFLGYLGCRPNGLLYPLSAFCAPLCLNVRYCSDWALNPR